MRKPHWLMLLLALATCSAQSNPPNCPGYVAGGEATLRQVIEAACIAVPASSPAPLDQVISSYAELNDEQDYLVGYYTRTPDNTLLPPLHLLRFNKSPGTWSLTDLSKATINLAPTIDAFCLGSVMSIQRAGRRFYVGTHLTPSAGCELVLDDGLKLRRTLYGWIVVSFSNGAVMFEHSMRHFAPTHPMKLSIYDPRRDSVTAMYPAAHDKLRAAYLRRLAEIPEGDRCPRSDNNCANSPEDFESDLTDGTVNEKTGSVALLVTFTAQGFLDRDKTDGVEFEEKVLYVYRGLPGPLAYRQYPASEMKTRFGTSDLHELLQPALLRRVFGEKRAR